jgi:hypothetical protein
MLEGRDPADFQAATGVLGLLGYATEKISHLDIEGAILGMDSGETASALSKAIAVRDWHSHLIEQLER